MPAGDIETYHDNVKNRWLNKIEGRPEPLSGEYITKIDAVAKGREMALYLSGFTEHSKRRTVEHIIRNEDGTISGRQTYPRSEDPRSSPG